MTFDFRELSAEDIPAIDRAASVARLRGSQYSAYNLYCLRHKYKTKIHFLENGGYVLRQPARDEGGLACYLLPPGLAAADAADIRELTEGLTALGRCYFWGLDDGMASALDAACPGRFQIEDMRDWADYLHETPSLVSPAGQIKYKIGKFNRTFPCDISPVSSADIPELLVFQKEWMARFAEGNGDPLSLKLENEAILTAFGLWEKLGLSGLCLRMDGDVRGFSYGRRHTDEVFIIHAMKCDLVYRNMVLVLLSAMAAGTDCPLINSEEDIGLPGLRLYKESLALYNLWRKHKATPIHLITQEPPV
jgi:hypothetical protein